MKKLFIIALLIIPTFAFAQKDTIGLNIPIRDGSVVYSGVVNVNGKSKADIYKNAKQWFVDYFKSSNDVIQNQDKDEGVIIGKGIIHFDARVGFGMGTTWYDKVTIKLECKDGRYRYSIYDMILHPYNAPNQDFNLESFIGKILGTQKMYITKAAAKDVIIKNDIHIKSTIASINEQMNKTITDF